MAKKEEVYDIGGVGIRVVEVDEINSDPDQLGQFEYDKQLVLLRKGMPHQVRTKILLHELVHALFEDTDVNSVLPDPQANEHVVRLLTPAIYRLIRDNPKLIDAIRT